jgi:hypothetical protein
MVLLELGDGRQVVDGLRELVSLFVDVRHAKHGGDGIGIVPQSLFVARGSAVKVALQLGHGP